MYAVIETGGKQYRVEVGTELEVELLDVEPGQAITLDRVLLVADGDESSIGRPLVADAAVSAEVLRQTRGEKLISFKYRPKARSRVKKGHRQELTVLRITDVRLGSKSAAEGVRKAEAEAKSERERLEEAAAKQAAADAALAAKLAKAAEAEEKADRSRHRPPSRRARRRSRRPRPRPTRSVERRRQGVGRRDKPAKAAPKAAAPKKPTPREEGRVTEMAHKKAGASVKNGRDSVGQRLGVKAGDGQLVPAGSIIVRQRGQTFLAGTGTGLARDYTVFATVTGHVRFEYATKSKKRIRVVRPTRSRRLRPGPPQRPRPRRRSRPRPSAPKRRQHPANGEPPSPPQTRPQRPRPRAH